MVVRLPGGIRLSPAYRRDLSRVRLARRRRDAVRAVLTIATARPAPMTAGGGGTPAHYVFR